MKPAQGMEDMKGDMGGRLRRRPHARARRAQGAGECRRPHRLRREHALRQRAASRRHCHLDVRSDDRGAQHGCGGPARARRLAVVRAGAVQAEARHRPRHTDWGDHGRARKEYAEALQQRRQARRGPPGGLGGHRREDLAHAAGQGLRQAHRQQERRYEEHRRALGRAITAAQFIQRFIKDTPWAHIDLAGTAMDAARNDINQSWGSGWGVRCSTASSPTSTKAESDDGYRVRAPCRPGCWRAVRKVSRCLRSASR